MTDVTSKLEAHLRSMESILISSEDRILITDTLNWRLRKRRGRAENRIWPHTEGILRTALGRQHLWKSLDDLSSADLLAFLGALNVKFACRRVTTAAGAEKQDYLAHCGLILRLTKIRRADFKKGALAAIHFPINPLGCVLLGLEPGLKKERKRQNRRRI